MRTLLLSSSFFPLRIISWDRAVKMRYEGTADVVAEYPDEIRSPSVTWRIPAVIRERRSVKVKHHARFSRRNVFLRDDYRCQYCGEQFDDDELTYDHVIPKSQGGRRNWTNIVTACNPCNRRKGNRECDEVGMFPINMPVRPKRLPTVAPHIDRETAPVEWLAYCDRRYRRELRRQAKRRLIESYGGCCQKCGHTSESGVSLSFDHRKPENKTNGSKNFLQWSAARIERELVSGDCWLLCLNCHAELENERWKTLEGEVTAV